MYRAEIRNNESGEAENIAEEVSFDSIMYAIECNKEEIERKLKADSSLAIEIWWD